MKNSLKLLCAAIVILMVFGFSLKAQQTNIYTDPASDYKAGLSLFQQQNFGAAQEAFRKAIATYRQQDLAANHLQLIDAYYFDARCSKALNRPDAEKLFIDLVSGHEENATTRMAYFHLADLYFQQKKYDKALTWFRKVDPADLSAEENTQYEFQLGFSYFYKKNFEKAKPLFADVKKQKGNYYYPANYYYAYIAYQDGEMTDALSAFKEAENTDLYRNIVPYYIANIYFLQKKYDEVIRYTNGLANNDKLQYALEFRQLTGKAYFEKGQYSQAMPYFTEYLAGTPKISKADIYQIGYCQYKTGKYADAINSFKELNALDDSLGQNALYLMADCYLKTGEKKNARLAFEEASKLSFDPFVTEHASFQCAKLAFELNYHDVAAKSLQDFLKTYPSSSFAAEAKELLSLEFLSTKNYEDALSVIRSMDSRNAAIRKAYQKVAYSRATELFNENKMEECISILNESLKNPVDASLQAAAYFWKGEAYYKQQQYTEAIASFSQFNEFLTGKLNLPAHVSKISADYDIGYCYLNQQLYSNASQYFQKVMNTTSGAAGGDQQKLWTDATLRNADCGFVLKNYSAALESYKSIASRKLPGADYALFQQAIILGLQNKTTEKLATLKNIISDYPASIYIDDAIYESGTTYLSVPAYQDAAAAFGRIISEYPKSNYVSKAHLKMGLIYFNLSKEEDALREYRWVLSKYPKSPEGAEALNGVKEIFTGQGNAQAYLDFVKGIPNVDVSDAVKDSVMYQAAENKYAGGDCTAAIRGFTSYLDAFPSGIFALHAHFYRAECLFKIQDNEKAYQDYEYVASQPTSRFTEKSLLNAARISYVEKRDYQSAYNHYKALRENAEFKANYLEAAKGMMYSAWYLNHYNDVIAAAQWVLSAENAKPADFTEAHYYLAKVYDAQDQLTKAFAEYQNVANEKSVVGAEAGYRMAEIYFRQNNLKAAEEQCYAMLKQKPGYDYWIAKSYLLIADIFNANGDYFQAKATLQSIIDNYKGADEIVATASQKLEQVKAKEASQSRLKQDESQNEMELDSIPANNLRQ